MQWWMAAAEWRVRTGLAIVLGGLLTCATGCTLPDWLSRTTPAPSGQTAADNARGLSVTALPVYRLLTSPVLLDSPSRLLVVQVRLSAADSDSALSITLDNVALVLANGERARVLDRARAVEVLRRTTIGEADFSYLLRPDHLPGGLSEYSRPYLTDMVVHHLLTDGAFTGEEALQGYVVVDTGAPYMSLDGASLQVVAYRLRDAAPARAAYQFTTAPSPGSEGH